MGKVSSSLASSTSKISNGRPSVFKYSSHAATRPSITAAWLRTGIATLSGAVATDGLFSGCGIAGLSPGAGTHQYEWLFVAPGPNRISADLFEFPVRDVLPPFGGAFRRHHDVMWSRAAGPHVEVLPFQEGIDRSTEVEGEQVGLGPEKQDDVGLRGV